MISVVVLSFIAAQTGIASYVCTILPKKDNFNKLLNVFLFILFFHLGTKLFFLIVFRDTFLYNNNATGFGLSYGPLLYLLAKGSKNKLVTKKIMFYHLLPFFAFTALYIVNCIGYLTGLFSETMLNEYALAYQWLVMLSLLVYPVLSLWLMKKNNAISATAETRLISIMAYLVLSGVLVGILYGVARFSAIGKHDFDLRLVPYVFIACISFFIIRYKLKQQAVMPLSQPQHILLPEAEEIHPEKKYKKSAIDKEMMDSYEVALEKFMSKSKIYLQLEVSLEDLSEGSKIPKHHLTQLLNERFEKNFYSFINEYRIEEAIKKLQSSTEQVSLSSLAYDCGFNSKSSFNNYFKKMTGYTPSNYRKEHLFDVAEE